MPIHSRVVGVAGFEPAVLPVGNTGAYAARLHPVELVGRA
jgi:hypothetical protein